MNHESVMGVGVAVGVAGLVRSVVPGDVSLGAFVGVGISTGLNVGPMNIYSDSCVKSSIYKLEVPVIEPKANAILDPSGDQAASKMS